MRPTGEKMRPSKVVMTHAPGSLYGGDSKGLKSAIVLSPDYWKKYEVIEDERLAKYLDVKEFRSPKHGWSGNNFSGINVARFPQRWFCPKCRLLQYNIECQDCQGVETIPPRMVAGCTGGHIQDFPWKAWVGCRDSNHKLYLHSSNSPESDLEVRCNDCNNTQTMKSSMGELQFSCLGKRPWLGDVKEADQKCDRKLHGMMRGGSNVYFPIVTTSILIPPWSTKLHRKVLKRTDKDAVKTIYDSTGGDSDNQTFKDVLKVIVDKYKNEIEQGKYERSEIEAGLLKCCDLQKPEDLKSEEWDTLTDPLHYIGGDFHAEKVDISGNPFLSKYFKKVVAVKKLSEIIALRGFTRIETPVPQMDYADSNTSDHARQKIREDKIGTRTKIGDAVKKKGLELVGEHEWYPAVKNKGEGIFFQFEESRLSKWETRDKKWSELCEEMTGAKRVLSEMHLFDYSPRALMVHTFAHKFSKEVANHCGYLLTSIRERLYADRKKKIAGVLVYTAAPDSEGSLGGLVSQALDINVLEAHIKRMMANSEICSQDPLCSLHAPTESKPWGAACHSCSQVPETSCESLMNKFLDRHTITGDKMSKNGYFQ